MFGLNNSLISHLIPITRCANVNEYKSLLAQWYAADDPLIVYYPLAQETTEQLTIPAITAPQSSAMTILAETATPPAEISAEYYQDVNKKLLEKDKKIEELQALILENIGG